MTPFETYTVFCASTAHLEEEDTDKLVNSHLTHVRPTGIIIKMFNDTQEILDLCSRTQVSEACKNVLLLAFSTGHEVVEFDCDATVYDFLPTFDW